MQTNDGQNHCSLGRHFNNGNSLHYSTRHDSLINVIIYRSIKTPKYTEVTPKYTEVYRSTSKYTEVDLFTPRYTKVSGITSKNTEVYQSTPKYNQVNNVHLSYYMFPQGKNSFLPFQGYFYWQKPIFDYLFYISMVCVILYIFFIFIL